MPLGVGSQQPPPAVDTYVRNISSSESRNASTKTELITFILDESGSVRGGNVRSVNAMRKSNSPPATKSLPFEASVYDESTVLRLDWGQSPGHELPVRMPRQALEPNSPSVVWAPGWLQLSGRSEALQLSSSYRRSRPIGLSME
jgi:hypothetical protein